MIVGFAILQQMKKLQKINEYTGNLIETDIIPKKLKICILAKKGFKLINFNYDRVKWNSDFPIFTYATYDKWILDLDTDGDDYFLFHILRIIDENCDVISYGFFSFDYLFKRFLIVQKNLLKK